MVQVLVQKELGQTQQLQARLDARRQGRSSVQAPLPVKAAAENAAGLGELADACELQSWVLNIMQDLALHL